MSCLGSEISYVSWCSDMMYSARCQMPSSSLSAIALNVFVSRVAGISLNVTFAKKPSIAVRGRLPRTKLKT